MANRANPYEAAFEAYLQHFGIPYVAVDEAKRTLRIAGQSLKSLDFIVAAGNGSGWLVDVKGRRFPGGGHHKRYWTNWSTLEDLRGLAEWERLFGQQFCGLFAFAYLVTGPRLPLEPARLFPFQDRLYAFFGLPLAQYAAAARGISPRWGTVAVPARLFRSMARPIDEFLNPFASPRSSSDDQPASEVFAAPIIASMASSPAVVA